MKSDLEDTVFQAQARSANSVSSSPPSEVNAEVLSLLGEEIFNNALSPIFNSLLHRDGVDEERHQQLKTCAHLIEVLRQRDSVDQARHKQLKRAIADLSSQLHLYEGRKRAAVPARTTTPSPSSSALQRKRSRTPASNCKLSWSWSALDRVTLRRTVSSTPRGDDQCDDADELIKGGGARKNARPQRTA